MISASRHGGISHENDNRFHAGKSIFCTAAMRNICKVGYGLREAKRKPASSCEETALDRRAIRLSTGNREYLRLARDWRYSPERLGVPSCTRALSHHPVKIYFSKPIQDLVGPEAL